MGPLGANNVEYLVDEVIGVGASTRRAWRKGGRLRPVLRAAVAAGIMNFEARLTAGEFQSVQEKLRAAFMGVFEASRPGRKRNLRRFTSTPRSQVTLPGEAEFFLKQAATHIRAEHDAANLHLSVRDSASGLDQVVAVVRNLQGEVNSIKDELRSLRGGTSSVMMKLGAVDDNIGKLLGAFQKLSTSGTAQAGGDAPAAVTESNPKTPRTVRTSPGRAGRPTEVDADMADMPDMPDVAAPAPAPAAFNWLATCTPATTAPRVFDKLKDFECAIDMLMEALDVGGYDNLRYGGQNPTSIRDRFKTAWQYFKAMASAEEWKLLLSKATDATTVQARHKIAVRLDQLISQYVVYVMVQNGIDVPYSMNKSGGKYKMLKPTTLEFVLGVIANSKNAAAVNAVAPADGPFATFRAGLEAGTIRVQHVNAKRKAPGSK